MTRLFYAPVGETPRQIRSDGVFHHPNGDEIHNPKPNPALDILPLLNEVAKPDPVYFDSTDSYSRSLDEQEVVMTWTSQPRPIAPIYQTRLTELREYARQFSIRRAGFDDQVFALQALAHQARITSGQTDPGDEYHFLKDDGEWAIRTAVQVESFVRRIGKDINEVGVQYEVHKNSLTVLRDAGDIAGLLAHDITTGWPT